MEPDKNNQEPRKEDLVCAQEFQDFVKEQKGEHKIINDKLDELKPLKNLIPYLQSSVQAQKLRDENIAAFGKWAKVWGPIIGAVGGIIGLGLMLKEVIAFIFKR